MGFQTTLERGALHTCWEALCGAGSEPIARETDDERRRAQLYLYGNPVRPARVSGKGHPPRNPTHDSGYACPELSRGNCRRPERGPCLVGGDTRLALGR